MKLFLSLLAAGVLAFGATTAQAAETTNKICTTDSYGNQSCSESTTTSTAQEISYVSEVKEETTGVEILNTSTPTVFQSLAIGSVVLGAAALVLKKKLNA
ncbi:MAG: hypothetical protein Q4G02_00135 [bacterium]|nr:hypothetical protein [bacterium]